MSMISAQIDGLRERAKELRNLAPDPDVPYLVPSTKETMALAMRSAASEIEDAADIIWQLRDDLQRTHGLLEDAEHDESRAWDRVRKAEAEADKLREERDMYRDLVDNMVHPDVPDQLAAENAKLLEIIADLEELLPKSERLHIHETTNAIADDNAKLRKLLSNLLLRMADTQARLEFMESENVKLREERDYYKALCEHATVTDCELRRVRTAWKEDRKQNDKLRQMVARMWPMATRAKRCTFADRLKLRAEIDELGIEVGE